MLVRVEMEIETNGYGGKEFKEEIERLIKDLDKSSKLTKFLMTGKDSAWDETADYSWSIK